MLQEVTSGKSATKKQPLYERHAGFHVLRLSGDDYEIGYQHGSALKSAMATGPVPYFERYVERMLAAGAGPKLGELLSKALALTVGRRIQSGFPPHTRRALDGLADGAGLDRKQLLAAVTMPESYLWVLQQVLRLRRPRLAPHHGVPLMGCTSAVAWGDATRDGSFLHGRNFDYQGVGAWDTEQAIVFHRPTGAQPYVSVSAAGILFGGITAMNASGITLVVHQHMASTALQLGGTPIGVTGDQVMRHAKSLDDARRILDSDRQNGCWTYVIGSAKEGAVLCYETTPARSAAHVVSAGTFGYSNFYLDRELARTERELYPSHWRNNLARYRRANARLEAERGRIDADTIAGILGDPGDESCRIEEAISQLMTVASVVFEPSAGMFYVATGRAPTSNNEFVAFSLDGEAPLPSALPSPAVRSRPPSAPRPSTPIATPTARTFRIRMSGRRGSSWLAPSRCSPSSRCITTSRRCSRSRPRTPRRRKRPSTPPSRSVTPCPSARRRSACGERAPATFAGAAPTPTAITAPPSAAIRPCAARPSAA